MRVMPWCSREWSAGSAPGVDCGEVSSTGALKMGEWRGAAVTMDRRAFSIVLCARDLHRPKAIHGAGEAAGTTETAVVAENER